MRDSVPGATSAKLLIINHVRRTRSINNRTSPIRKHSRFPVRWPVLYSGEDFVGEGTVLDITQTGWRLACAMPVDPGMRLTLHLWPQGKGGPIRIQQATVLWVKGCEFALDVPELAPEDGAWLARFLDHRLGRWLIRDGQARNPVSPPLVESTAASEEIVSKEHPAVDEVQAEILARSIRRREDPAKEGEAALRLLRQSEVLRIVRGMQAWRALRIREGTDAISRN